MDHPQKQYKTRKKRIIEWDVQKVTRASVLVNAAGTSFLEIFNLVYNIESRI